MVEIMRIRLTKGRLIAYLFSVFFICRKSNAFIPQTMTSLLRSDSEINHLLGSDHRDFGPNHRHRSSSLKKSPLSVKRVDNTEKEDNDKPVPLSPTGMQSNLTIIVPLLLVYISNQWSRSSLYYLVDFANSEKVTGFNAMNVDLGFSQAQYGVLASLAFTALFAIASLFAGSLADRNDRKLLTVGSALAWTAAIFVTATSGSYNAVLIARIFMGLACAFSTPSAYTLINDFVQKDQVAFANSLYSSGIYLGGGLSSLSLLLNENIGWRGTCGVIGSFGLVSAALSAVLLPADPKMQTIPEIPTRMSQSKDSIDEESSPLTDVINILSKSRVQWIFAASFLRFCAGLCIGVWSATYFKLAFPDDSTSYAVINALIVGFCGVSSGIFGGWAADRSSSLSDKFNWDNNVGRLLIPVVGSILAVPAWWLTIHASTFNASMFWLAVEYLVAECWFGPTVAVLQSEVQKKQGGTALGMFTLTGAIGNLAPSLVGILYGNAKIAGGIEEEVILSGILSNGICVLYFASAIAFAIAASSSKKLRSE